MAKRTLSIFSGVGGIELGLERAGTHTPTFFCENDDYAAKVLELRWPGIPNFKRGIISLNALLRRVSKRSLLGSRARISRMPGEAPDYPGLARDSFGILCEPFAWYDPESCSWKTWQRCLIEGWEPFSGKWPRSGMMRNGIAYRRRPLAPLIAGTASSSLLPTPAPRPCSGKRSSGMNRTEIMNALEMWPTSTASLGTKGGRVTPRKGREGGTLIEAVSARTEFATPTARDWRSGKASEETHCKNSRPLSEQVGGALNPTWVEWLMGFPKGWTDLDVLETASSLSARNTWHETETD